VTVRTHRVPLSGSARSLEVGNPAGSTSVEADPAAEEIVFQVVALNSAAEELIDRLDLVVTGATVRLSVPDRRLLRTPSFAITVTTPPDVPVTVTGASADTTVRGRLAGTVVTSASGDVTVEHCTDLQVRTASGDLRVDRVQGTATVATASGDIQLAGVGGAVQARSASGDIVLGDLATDATVQTASGDVRIDRASSGTLRLTTVSGDATVGVAPGLRIWLDVQTVSGRMRSELDGADPDQGGAPQLTVVVKSVSGDLLLRRAVPRPPQPPTRPTPPAPPAVPVPPAVPWTSG
jgi:hypothetical protein